MLGIVEKLPEPSLGGSLVVLVEEMEASSPGSGGGLAPLKHHLRAPLLLALLLRGEGQLPTATGGGVCGGGGGRSGRRGGGGGGGGEDGDGVGGGDEFSELFLEAGGADAAGGAAVAEGVSGALHAAFSAVFMHRFHPFL